MYLEVTFRKGKPLAAYLYLPRQADDASSRTVKQESGLLVDFAEDGRPIGIEIPSPRKLSIGALNDALSFAQQPPVQEEDVAPLLHE